MLKIGQAVNMLRRQGGVTNKTARTDAMGDVQLIILCSLWRKSAAAVGAILQSVFTRTEDVLDVAQTYSAIDRMAEEDRGWVEEVGKEPSSVGGRDVSVFRLTPTGREAVEEKMEHMRRVLAACEAMMAEEKEWSLQSVALPGEKVKQNLDTSGGSGEVAAVVQKKKGRRKGGVARGVQ
jgi:DNA-binding PadR family transcriptional regulator